MVLKLESAELNLSFVVNWAACHAEVAEFKYSKLIYYIVGQSLLQTCTSITKCSKFITKWYYKAGIGKLGKHY